MFTGRKSKSSILNSSSKNFIPVACHYNKFTMLTKNGELLQTIRIKGINSDKISENLSSLRVMVRKAITESVDSTKFSFWVHTIRRRDNLDDPTKYPNFFSANIHEAWTKKNYWNDKFVNSLYITIVHYAPKLDINNFSAFVNSFFPKRIADFEEKFLKVAAQDLTDTVDKMINILSEFKARRIGIKYEEDGCFSELMSLYRRIAQLQEEPCEVPIGDVSSVLASHNYTIGNDALEVAGKDGKTFAAIVSVKEYHEISAESLDKFLQIPVEMIATEVFHFTSKSQVVPNFEHQNYILGISGDKKLKEMKNIEKIVNTEDNGMNFCSQKISFMIIDDDLEILDKKLIQASNVLSSMGIVHIREDINLEKTFWAQLPANFSFLSRMNPTIIDHVAALASLYNFPTGSQYNPWGRAVTLLRTDRGLLYFMNFHDLHKQTTTCIFGEKKSGKTTLMNFLLSEVSKFRPTTIYITDDIDSALFVKAQGGNWFQRDHNIINPLLCEDSVENRDYVFDFIQIIAGNDFDPMDDQELTSLEKLQDIIFEQPIDNRSLSLAISELAKKKNISKKLLVRLANYTEKGRYYNVFERQDQIIISEGHITAFNLQLFIEINEHFPVVFS